MGLAPLRQLWIITVLKVTQSYTASSFAAKGPLSPARPHAKRASHAALHRESTVIYRCSRQDATLNTRALGERNHTAPVTALSIVHTSFFCSHIRAKGSLSPARPHEQRVCDAALCRHSTVIYRSFRQGVTPNTRTLEETKHAAAAAALSLIFTALRVSAKGALQTILGLAHEDAQRQCGRARAESIQQRGPGRGVRRGMTRTRRSPQVAKRKA